MTTKFDLTKNATPPGGGGGAGAGGGGARQQKTVASPPPPPHPPPPRGGGSPNEIWDAPEAHEPMTKIYNEIANCRCKVRCFFNPKL